MKWVKKRGIEFSFLFIISISFIILASWNITLPGLNEDEAVEPAIAMNIFYNEEMLFHYSGLFGKNFFTMVGPYTGPSEVYPILPFYYLFGVNLYTIRAYEIGYGLLCIILLFYFVKELFHKKIAYITTILFTTMPTTIFYFRQGTYVNHVILIPVFLSFIFFLKFLKKKKISHFYLGSFFLGVGFTTKITFWWIIPPLLLLVRFFNVKLKINLWQTFVSFYFFCLGAVPIIFYNIASRGGTLKLIFTGSPQENINFFSNLLLRLEQLVGILNSRLSDFGFGANFSTYFFILFIAAIIFILVRSLYVFKENKKILFVMFLIIMILLESVFTVSKLLELHLLILIPFCLLIVSYFLYAFFDRKKLIFFALLSLVLLLNVLGILFYYNTLERTGGVAQMSDAIYGLAGYLEENGINRPLAVDWGFIFNIRVLTNGKVRPFGIFVYPDKEGNYLEIFEKTCLEEFKNPDSVYIFTAPDFTLYERFDDFNRIAKEAGKRIVLEKTFYQRNGEPVYILYKVLDL